MDIEKFAVAGRLCTKERRYIYCFLDRAQNLGLFVHSIFVVPAMPAASNVSSQHSLRVVNKKLKVSATAAKKNHDNIMCQNIYLLLLCRVVRISK